MMVQNSPVLDEFGESTGYFYLTLYPGVKEQFLKASSYYLTGTLGGAYAITDTLSASFGLRYINAVNTTKMGFTLTDSPMGFPDLPLALDSKDKARRGGIRPGSSLLADCQFRSVRSLREQDQAGLRTTTVNKDDFGLVQNGAKSRRDLPAVLYLGAGYRWSEKLQMLVDFNYYFQRSADWGITEVD